MKKLFILKIGGSVATYKDNIENTVRKDLLQEVFAVLAGVYAKSDFGLIIVHGAGGHVHHLAHEYKLKGGTKGDTKKEAGAIHTQETVEQLHREIMKIGTASTLPLQSFLTHDVITQDNQKINSCDTQDIQEALSNNQIPVLYGDMVNDTTLGMSICSGDAVTSHLSTLLPVSHILFATDVDGIYTADPHTNPDAAVVESLALHNIENVVELTESHNKDTTGGLRGKIQACSTLFETSASLTEIHIFNGLHSKNYTNAFEDKSFVHTKITE